MRYSKKISGVLCGGLVTTLVAATGCSGDESPHYALRAPRGPEGTAELVLRGGSASGDGASGGDGGAIQLNLDPIFPSSVGIYTTGTVDTDFDVPTIATDLGPYPVIFDVDTTVGPIPAEPVEGAIYYAADFRSLVRVSNGTPVPVSGFSVPAGVTLTFDGGDDALVELVLSHDLTVEGTLTAKPRDVDGGRPRLRLIAGDIVGHTPTVLLDAPEGKSTGGFALDALGTLVWGGEIHVRGASGAVATDSGGAYFGAVNAYVSASVDARGGDATSNGVLAGNGGPVRIFAALSLRVAGSIDARGGSGVNDGGAGGNVVLEADQSSPLRRASIVGAPVIDTHGGDCETTCQSGLGGSVTVIARHGTVRLAGSIDTRGGNGLGPSAYGQYGGDVVVGAINHDAAMDVDSVVDFGASLDTSGGDGVIGGGRAGSFRLFAEQSTGGLVRMLGIRAIDTSGGAGYHGGDAGDLVKTTNRIDSAAAQLYVPDHFHLYSDVIANGGAGVATGGSGGTVGSHLHWNGFVDDANVRADVGLLIAGDIRANGGAAPVGGDAGGIAYTGMQSVEIDGSMQADGGNGKTGGSLILYTAGSVDVRGTLTFRGGDAQVPGEGGRGGYIGVNAARVRFDALVDLTGGDGMGAMGGRGGFVEIASLAKDARVAGTFSVEGGEGTPQGALGTISVDGVTR